MLRDVTWRPTRPPAVWEKRNSRVALVAGLLGMNAAVIVYHGDPRDHMRHPDSENSLGAGGESSGLSPTTQDTGAGTDAGWTATEDVVEGKADQDELEDVCDESTPAGAAGEIAAEEGAPAAGLPSGSRASSGLPRSCEACDEPGVLPALSATAGLRAPGPVQRVAVLSLAAGQTVAEALSRAGAQPDEVHAALTSLGGLVDFRRLRPGNVLKARFDRGKRLISLDVHSGALERVRAERREAGWLAQPLALQIDTVLTRVTGEVRTSLWDALVGSGERPQLVAEIVDMFAWDIDFYAEVYPGDSFRVLVEKRFLEGGFAEYGALLAGEFVSAGQRHRAYRFVRRDGGYGYYDEQGRSMRKQLLRSPLQYGSVTSGFGKRRHPILGYSRQHNGIDYGVPTGTPVWSVGDGRITKAGWLGGYGKMIEVRHANGWTSQYAHLSRIDVAVGQRVSQKQFIGRVGSTGLSTGPHLHYGLRREGAYLNPAAQKFERSQSLNGDDLQRFMAQVKRLAAELENVDVAREAGMQAARSG